MKKKTENRLLGIFRFSKLYCLITVCATFTGHFLLVTTQETFAQTVTRSEIDSTSVEIENLRAFAKLWGYVKFFHPSDEASSIDWERFAIHGIQYVKNANSSQDLRDRLFDLFEPIAPTIQIYSTEGELPEPHPALIPGDTTGLKLIAWQHKGTGYGNVDYYQSIRLNRPPDEPVSPLFSEHPEPGEVVERILGRGLSAQIPLALFSNEGKTVRPDDVPSLSPLVEMLRSVPIDNMTGSDEALRLANVVIAWNIFQHFYPYFDVVDVDWNNVLYETLRMASEDRTAEEFLNTLKWMVVQLEDGHGSARLHQINEYASLPFIIREVEGELIITSENIDIEGNTCDFRYGDIITSINGEPAGQWFQKARDLASGTPQWKTAFALSELTYGRPEQFNFVLTRPEQSVTCEVARDYDYSPKSRGRLNPIETLRDGIYYVDLSRASMEAIEEQIDTLATAKGIIFDLRSYPNNSITNVLQYLSRDTLRSAHWQVPLQIYPDQMEIVAYDTSGRWTLIPKEPYLSGKNVFLIGKNTISYGESIMGIVEHYRLAEIVGETSAGTNGGVNSFSLPGDYHIWWTGMRVVKHDYSQHHLVGIRPTVPVTRTVGGVRAGRDEYIEKALEIIEASISR